MRLRPGPAVRAAGRLLRTHVGRSPAPIKLNLCLTYWCQYRCKTCNIWQRQPSDELTTDEWLAFVRASRETSWVDLTGGEIFLRPDVEVILLAVAREWKRLAVLHFPTNGFLTDRIVAVTERVARKTRVPVVATVSLDGFESLNDEIRGLAGGYRRQLATFAALRRIPGVQAVLGYTISRYNAGRLRDTVEACRSDCPGVTIRDFHVNVAQRSAHYYGHDAGDDPTARVEDVRRELAWYAAARGAPTSLPAWMEGRFLRLLDAFLRDGVSPLPCHALRSSCFVDPWGIVYPCITYARPIGSLRESGMDLRPIWAGAQAESLAPAIWRGDCPQCWTACEAYQSLLGNVLAPWRRRQDRGSLAKASARE